MAKTHTKKRSEVDLSVNICSDITGTTGDVVYWTGVPSTGCSVTKGNTEWPFGDNPSPINNPATTHPKITVNPPATTAYQIVVSCCANEAIKYVHVN
jgi:hypothetical protein